MKIVFLCYPTSNQTAPHQAMAAFALARLENSVTYLAWGNDLPADWLTECAKGIKYKIYPKRSWLSAFRFLAAVARTLILARPDCLYVQGAHQTPFVLWLLCLPARFEVVYHTQDYLDPGQNWFYETCERLFAKYADWVISNEANRARFMASSYRLERMPEVIRTAFPAWWQIPDRDETYRQALIQASGLGNVDCLKLIVAGGAYRVDRMSPQLLDALAILPKNYVVVFTACPPGSTSRRLCEEHARRLKLDKRVIFCETPDYKDMLRLISACDIGILLYPNYCIGHFYQSPGRLTEYLRCGLPIVASNFPGLELLVMKHNLGEVADPYSPASIAAAIRKLGDVPEPESAMRRQRLREVANADLAYETQALPVFEKVFGVEAL
jgi:glycosyltransferase involved in cell wall biosynthesis